MKLSDLAKKAAALPSIHTFEWVGVEQYHDSVFKNEVKTLPELIQYTDALRKRMAEYAGALEQLCQAYGKLRDLILEAQVGEP